MTAPAGGAAPPAVAVSAGSSRASSSWSRFAHAAHAAHPARCSSIAARSLGLSHAQTLRMIVLPQGVRKVTPALVNDFVSMQKDVGLISILGAVDAVRSAQIEVASSYNFTPYVIAGLLFVAISWPLIRLTDWLAARAQRREQIGGTV